MQRMIVVLVVLLIAAVAVLGVTTLRLQERLDHRLSARADTGGRDVSPAELAAQRDAAARVGVLERQVSDLTRELARVRDRAAPGAAAGAGTHGGGAHASPGDGPARPAGSGSDDASDDDYDGFTPARDSGGSFVITSEDEAYFEAVQEKIQQRRRLDGMVNNTMRRVERLATRGEMGALTDNVRAQIEPIVREYVHLSDDMLQRYLRKPTGEIAALDQQQRRDRMDAERTVAVAQARDRLTPILGAVDAEKVAETVIQGNWGLRYRDRAIRRN
jgi:hypothetical protein